MGNLRKSKSRSGGQRPYQSGSVEGTKNNLPVKASKEWLVDTGAEVSVLTKSNADQFDLTPTGATAWATSSGGGILMKSGVTMVFKVLQASGTNLSVRCSLPVGVRPNDKGGDILGMDQVADRNAKVRWDPSALDGDLYD